MKRRIPGRNGRSGAALVEFALTALVLYILVIGGIELGRAIFVSQVLQQTARVAARELSVTPLPADYTFDCADPGPNTCVLNDLSVLTNIWNPNLLVIDVDCYQGAPDALQNYLSSLPLVNRALQPALISDTINPGGAGGNQVRLLRYPGALTGNPGSASCAHAPATYAPDPADRTSYGNPWGLTIQIYQLNSDGSVNPTPLPVLSEVRNDASDPDCAVYGPFSFSDPGSPPMGSPCVSDTPPALRGIASIAVNYPFQSAGLSGFASGGFINGEPNPNLGHVIVSDDPVDTPLGTYTGPHGLGNQAAFAEVVRPYRILLLGQAMFRREVTDK